MYLSSIISLIIYIVCFFIYINSPPEAFKSVSSSTLWLFNVLLLIGVLAGNLRNIALPVAVTILVPEDRRDKANGLIGMTSGIAFLIVSVISGILVGRSGMYEVLILAIGVTILTMIHLLFLPITEKKLVHLEGTDGQGKLDIKGTLKVIRKVPGLFALIFFTMFNNFLGGVFMSLMDAYGLSMVSVEVWGFLWGVLSTAFIIGGFIISKWGLGKDPLSALFRTNIIIWVISSVFTIYPSIIPLTIGMFIYLSVVPYIEAAEHTVIQKVVPPERQGRVFGFAQSVEQSASPIMSFTIGPLAQFFFIPFMTTGLGAQLIGSWFGTGEARGIALVFTITGIIGLALTLISWRSKYYKQLQRAYAK